MSQAKTPTRYIARRDDSYDPKLRDLIEQFGLREEVTYFGITSPARADEVRRGYRRAGSHLGVAVKAYTADCTSCPDGGPDCRYHVLITAYPMQDARDYMRRKAALLNWPVREPGND